MPIVPRPESGTVALRTAISACRYGAMNVPLVL